MLFLVPSDVLSREIEQIGITKIKAQAIRTLARQIAEGKLNLTSSANLSETKEQLSGINGIGPWTVEMIGDAMSCGSRCFSTQRSFGAEGLSSRKCYRGILEVLSSLFNPLFMA